VKRKITEEVKIEQRFPHGKIYLKLRDLKITGKINLLYR